MLRITVLNDARVTTFKMEGKLAQEWVIEAEKVWAEFAGTAQQQRISVDLCGVSFVDEPGRELLTRMHSSGAKLIGTGPMTSALIEEICGRARPPLGKWIRSALSLFFLLLLTGLMPRSKNLFICRSISPSVDALSGIQERIVRIHPSVRFASVPGEKTGASVFRKGLPR